MYRKRWSVIYDTGMEGVFGAYVTAHGAGDTLDEALEQLRERKDELKQALLKEHDATLAALHVLEGEL